MDRDKWWSLKEQYSYWRVEEQGLEVVAKNYEDIYFSPR